MKIEHMLLAKGSSVDKDSQSLSIFEMIEQVQIQSPKFPVNVPVHAVLVFRRENSEDGVLNDPWQLRLVSPDGAILLRQNLDVKMEAKHKRQRLRMNFPLQVQSDGVYQMELRHRNDDQNLRSLDVDVRAITDISQGRPPQI